MRIISETETTMEMRNHEFTRSLWLCRFMGSIFPLIGVFILAYTAIGIHTWGLGIGFILGIALLTAKIPKSCLLDTKSNTVIIESQKAFQQKSTSIVYDLQRLSLLSIHGRADAKSRLKEQTVDGGRH
jgi:hypothetical protein